MKRAVVPPLEATLQVPGVRTAIGIWRDPEGIPHVRADSAWDAFLGQGFVHAQDRLWQMEYDRRRGSGRWAEYIGPKGVAQDVAMRRRRLAASARSDYAQLNVDTRAMLDGYAAGVNAFLATTEVLPVEFTLLETRPAPWQPWESVLVFKVRHADMGTWQVKVWRARLVRHLGAARAATLCPGTQPNPMLIVPPGETVLDLIAGGLEELGAYEGLGVSVPESSGGSNNWAVSGRRTRSGRPLLAGDPHRALEVPNVYYQNHISCPEFDAVGLSFPGVPGLPHFGHNAQVAWSVTHTNADAQDLYLERFDAGDPTRYDVGGEWRAAEVERETIDVRGHAARDIDVTVTHHGPIILGDPRHDLALALADAALAGPNGTFEAFLPMLRARSADELEAAMRTWVDPVNNLVFADVGGAIGYRTRGRIPVRAAANAWVPVPGWDGMHEWQGYVPFDEMPAIRNPALGFVVSANSRVTGTGYVHYIGLDFSPDFRTRRLVARLSSLERATVADMVTMHTDEVSIPGTEFVGIFRGMTSGDPVVRGALERLASWDGRMSADSAAAAIYAVFRERLMRDVMTPILGPLAPEAFAGAPRGGTAHMARLRARLTEWIQQGDVALLREGATWPEVIARALAEAMAELRDRLGPDPARWRWGDLHRTQPSHPLSSLYPEWQPVLDPPAVPVGGDADTVRAGAFVSALGYHVTLTAVARYAFDVGAWDESGWIVPFGGSGHPGSPHFADQVEAWRDGTLLPMRYAWDRIRAAAASYQRLEGG